MCRNAHSCLQNRTSENTGNAKDYAYKDFFVFEFLSAISVIFLFATLLVYIYYQDYKVKKTEQI